MTEVGGLPQHIIAFLLITTRMVNLMMLMNSFPIGSAPGNDTTSSSVTIPAMLLVMLDYELFLVYSSTPHAPITEQDSCKFFSGGSRWSANLRTYTVYF